MIQSSQHWTILGAGAVGHLLACRFAMQNIPAVLVYRSKPNNQQGLANYRFNNTVQRCSVNYQAVNELQAIEYLLLTVKSYQVEEAILSIKDILTQKSQIFLLQNGMGTLEKVSHLLTNNVNPKQIYPGVNTHGVYLQLSDDNVPEVIHAGNGHLVFGNNYLHLNNKKQPECFSHLDALNINTSWSADIRRELWLKLAINAAINPITAVNNCPNGELYRSGILRKQVKQLCSETTELFKRLDLNINQATVQKKVFDVIDKTSSNHSSMLQDVKSGKKTEITAITGYLLEKANLLDITMTTHHELYQKITNLNLNS